MKNLILLILSLLALAPYGCDRHKRDDLSITRTDYDGSLRTDGYYYALEGNTEVNSFFLYRNGVFLEGWIPNDIVDLDEIDDYYKNPSNYSVIYDLADVWGVFIVEGSDMTIEKWIGSSGDPYPTAKSVGTVLNDTTLIGFNDLFGWSSQQDTFHFRQFSSKPDSTNVFVN